MGFFSMCAGEYFKKLLILFCSLFLFSLQVSAFVPGEIIGESFFVYPSDILLDVNLTDELGSIVQVLDIDLNVLQFEDLNNISCVNGQSIDENAPADSLYCDYNWTVPNVPNGYYLLNMKLHSLDNSSQQNRGRAFFQIVTPLTDGENGSITPIINSLIASDFNIGLDTAPLVLLEFSNPQCLWCRLFYNETLPDLINDFVLTGKLQIVFNPVILDYNPAWYGYIQSDKVIESLYCAREQELRAEMYDKLFEKQNELDWNAEMNFYNHNHIDINSDELKLWAEEISDLDSDAFNTCLDSNSYQGQLKTDSLNAMTLNLYGTPSFVLGSRDSNGELLLGYQSSNVLEEKLNYLLYGTYAYNLYRPPSLSNLVYGTTSFDFQVVTPDNSETHLQVSVYTDSNILVNIIEPDLNLFNYSNLDSIECLWSQNSDDINFSVPTACFYDWNSLTVPDGNYYLAVTAFLPGNEEGSTAVIPEAFTVYNSYPRISFTSTPTPLLEQYELDYFFIATNKDTNVLVSCDDNGQPCAHLHVIHYLNPTWDRNEVLNFNTTNAWISLPVTASIQYLIVSGTGASNNFIVPQSLIAVLDTTPPVVVLPSLVHSSNRMPSIDFNITDDVAGFDINGTYDTKIDFNHESNPNLSGVWDYNSIENIELLFLRVDGNLIDNSKLRVRAFEYSPSNAYRMLYQFSYALDYNLPSDYVLPISLDVNDNLMNSMHTDWNYFVDNNKPVMTSVRVNSGAYYTSNPVLTLSLSAQDNFTLQSSLQLAFSCNNTSFSSYEAFTSSKTFDVNAHLPVGCSVSDGNLTVYVRARDLAGNVSDTSSAGIYLDRLPPNTVTNLNASIADASVRLNWTASTDASSGFSQYIIYRSSTSGFNVTDSNATQVASNLLDTNYTESGLSAGTYYYRVIAVDAVGNRSVQSDQVNATISASNPALTSSNSENTGTGGGGFFGGSPTLGGTVSLGIQIQDTVSLAGELKESLTETRTVLDELSIPIPEKLTQLLSEYSEKMSELEVQRKTSARSALNNVTEFVNDLRNAKNTISVTVDRLPVTVREENETLTALLSFNEVSDNELVSNVSTNRELALVALTQDDRTRYYVRVIVKLTNTSNESRTIQYVEVVPKEIAQSASLLVSGVKFKVLEDDPIIVFRKSLKANESTQLVYGVRVPVNKIKSTALKTNVLDQSLVFASALVSSTVASLKSPIITEKNINEKIESTISDNESSNGPTGLAVLPGNGTGSSPTGFLELPSLNISTLTGNPLLIVVLLAFLAGVLYVTLKPAKPKTGLERLK